MAVILILFLCCLFLVYRLCFSFFEFRSLDNSMSSVVIFLHVSPTLCFFLSQHLIFRDARLSSRLGGTGFSSLFFFLCLAMERRTYSGVVYFDSLGEPSTHRHISFIVSTAFPFSPLDCGYRAKRLHA